MGFTACTFCGNAHCLLKHFGRDWSCMKCIEQLGIDEHPLLEKQPERKFYWGIAVWEWSRGRLRDSERVVRTFKKR